jgi:hypothetical protein
VAQIQALLDEYELKGVGTHVGYTQFPAQRSAEYLLGL